MPRPRFDMGSKWLLHNQGKSALLIGGFTDVQRIEAMPSEIVQNRKYPDGLLRVYLRGERAPPHVLIEVATYAEKRGLRQALDDLTFSYQALGHLPELLMLVLHPKGRFRISGRHAVQSKRGLSRLERFSSSCIVPTNPKRKRGQPSLTLRVSRHDTRT